MDQRQGYGSRPQFQYTSIPTNTANTNTKTHRRQRSEPSTSKPSHTTSGSQQRHHPGSPTTTTSTTNNNNNINNRPSSHSRPDSDTTSPQGHKTPRSDRSSIPVSSSSPFSLSSPSPTPFHGGHAPSSSSSSSRPRPHAAQHQPSHSRPKSSEPHSRSNRNDLSTPASNNPNPSGDLSSTQGVRGQRSYSESKSTRPYNNKDDYSNHNKKSEISTSRDSRNTASERDTKIKEQTNRFSNSNPKQGRSPVDDADTTMESARWKDPPKKGKPAHTPKTKRRPRSSSASRQSSSDDSGGGVAGRRREHNSHSGGEKDGESSSRHQQHQPFSSSSQIDASMSSPTSSTSTRPHPHDKMTQREHRDRRKEDHHSRDDSDVRSVKSEHSGRSKRATSAPRETRGATSSTTRDRNHHGADERKSHTKGSSSSYQQIPKSSTPQTPTAPSSMQTSSSKRHKSLMDVSDRRRGEFTEEEIISLRDMNPPSSGSHQQFDKHSKTTARYSYQTLKSSASVPNSYDPSKFYSRSDRDSSTLASSASSSSKSPKSFHRKQNSNTSDVVMTSDSERSTRGPSVSSAEEPLLPKGHHASSDSRSSQQRRTLPTPNVQTFPRMKTQKDASPKQTTSYQMYPVSTATVDRHQTGKTQFLLDRIRNFSSNPLPSQEDPPYFSPLHRIPSQSSLSSDNRSEVCLDLPDVREDDSADEFYNTGLKNNMKKIKTNFPVAPYLPIHPMPQPPSLCKTFLLNLLQFLVSFILVWPLLATVVVIVPVVFVIKKLFSLCCCCGRALWGRCFVCLCHAHLSSSELIWLGRGARSNPVVQCLIVIQRGLDTERIRHLIDSRILYVENRRGRKLYPRFTQKIIKFCCGQAWVTDRSFMTSNHVFNMPGYIETLDDLQQFISKMASEPLSFRHPLWEVQVMHNFREPRDTVLLFRMHMAMTDGVSMVHVLQNALVDSTKPSSLKATFSDEAANTSPFKVMLSGPLTFLTRYVFRRDDFNLLHGGHFETSGESVVAWSEPFSLSAALRVKQVARCTLTDLLLSITAGNIRTYLQVCGIRHPYDVTCAVPVDFQSMDVGTLDMENKYTVVHIPLPTNTEGAIPRLWSIKRIMEDFKGSAEAAIVSGARWLTCALMPTSCFQRLWRKLYSRCSVLVSNLAGPTSVLRLDSREVKCMMYWLPPLDRVAVTISFFTYADQIRMAVISDRSALPNPELMTRDFIYKLETLSKLLAHRRIPGESPYSSRHENVHLLSSFTLDDLTADQIQLEMSLVQQEIHDLKIQLDSGPADHISQTDHQLMARIEALKERSSELMMHLRKRKAEESESAVILSEEAEDRTLDHLDQPSRPFRRRTLSLSSRMSVTSATSTARPLSTASTSNLTTVSNHASPTHPSLPSWPEGDAGTEDPYQDHPNWARPATLHRFPHRPDPELDSPEHQAYRSHSQHLVHDAPHPPPTTPTLAAPNIHLTSLDADFHPHPPSPFHSSKSTPMTP